VENHVTSVTHVIQLAVAPVFLLTAIATLISALNVRLGRIVDRQRALQSEAPAGVRSEDPAVRQREFAQLAHRVHLSYLSILAAVFAGLFICLVVALAFVGVLLEVDLAKVLAVLFVLAMLSMITSLGLFSREIYIAVSARQRVTALTDPQPAAAGSKR
jgi:hypothetical protein